MTVVDIIQNKINVFLENIMYLSGPNRKKYISRMSQFQLFEKNEDPFYKQECFMYEIEDGIRKQLVIGTLIDLLNFDEILKSKLHVELNIPKTNFSYIIMDNYKYDDLMKILFTVNEVGYRFTTPLEDDVNSLLSEYGLSKIEVINFFNYKQNSNNKKIVVITIKDFFIKYFKDGDNLYNTYYRMIIDAIDRAKKLIGFKTVSILSLQHLNEFKLNLLNVINDIDFSKKVYVSKNKVKDLVEYDEIIINYRDNEYNDIYNRFKRNASILISDENFAKCFITAEYLYQTIKEQHHFDYTSIVCGYLKAIEELLYCFHKSTFINDNQFFIYKECDKKCKSEENCIFYNKKKNLNEKCRFYDDSCFLNDYKKKNYFFSLSKNNLEIGGLILQLMLNDNLCLVSKEIKECIWKCLDDYRKTCRNEHFHKDNIYNWDEVERIRDNSYLCLFYLLGSFKLKDDKMFSTYSNEYSRLYRSFTPFIRSSINCFIIETQNGDEIYAMRPYSERYENPEYDEKTAEIITPIILLKVNSFNDYNYGDSIDKFERIIINKNNIPKKMYWYNTYAGKNEIKW